jgi:hypothetical protein
MLQKYCASLPNVAIIYIVTVYYTGYDLSGPSKSHVGKIQIRFLFAIECFLEHIFQGRKG